MPVFDFSCNDCSEEFEFFLVRSYDTPSCPACSGNNLTKKTSSFKIGNSSVESIPPGTDQTVDTGHKCTSACNHGSGSQSNGSSNGNHSGCGVSIADSLRKKYGYD